jgi:hypothetical protein
MLFRTRDCVGWKHNGTAGWKPAVPSFQRTAVHLGGCPVSILAHTVRDSGRTTWKPQHCFGLEMRWLEAQRDRRQDGSGTV